MSHILPVNQKFIVLIGKNKFQICDLVNGAFEPVISTIYNCQQKAIKKAWRL